MYTKNSGWFKHDESSINVFRKLMRIKFRDSISQVYVTNNVCNVEEIMFPFYPRMITRLFCSYFNYKSSIIEEIASVPKYSMAVIFSCNMDV